MEQNVPFGILSENWYTSCYVETMGIRFYLVEFFKIISHPRVLSFFYIGIVYIYLKNSFKFLSFFLLNDS